MTITRWRQPARGNNHNDTSPPAFTNSAPRTKSSRGRSSPGSILPDPDGRSQRTNGNRRTVSCPLSSGGRDSLVATARGQTPDPIPNSAVKTLSADGTASQDAEEQVAARLSQPPIPQPPANPPTDHPPASTLPTPIARQTPIRHSRADPPLWPIRHAWPIRHLIRALRHNRPTYRLTISPRGGAAR